MTTPQPNFSAPPSGSVKPTAQNLSLTELEAQPSPKAPPIIDALRPPRDGSPLPTSNPLHQVRTKVTVCVGTAELTVGELLGAKAQQVIRLDQSLDQPVDVLLEGQVIARGTLVAVGEHFGVRITELPLPLKP